jgi:asparagine synthase (glutamine-hydrolysing)
MCSISGIIRSTDSASRLIGGDSEARSSNVDLLRATMGRMNRALRHRGPDDHGIAYVDLRSDPEERAGGLKHDLRYSKSELLQVCLGNTRLAIIDTTSAGHQPMYEPETANWITYNGETYNFRELRCEIGDEFGPWRSNTDTEVVLRAYRKWGIGAFEKLRGMFALAIWDAGKQELILARDRFGIKPLYYYVGDSDSELRNAKTETQNLFLFASEIRALLASGLVPRKLSSNGVASYLTYGSVQAPFTIIEGVRSLMPGHCLSVQAEGDAGLRLANFEFQDSTPEDTKVENGISRGEAVARLRAQLEESVRLHLVSDVPLGVFLSGGMDSSALVALMSRVSKERPKTFSVVFDDQQFTEAHHSRLVAEKFHTDHREVHLGEDRLLKMLPDALSSLDQPTIDGLNTYVVSKAVKETGITVALSGLGSDELFGGYPSFRRVLRLQSISGPTKGLLRAVSGAGKRALNGSVQRKKFWQLAASEGQPLDVYSITRQLFPPDEVHRFRISNLKMGEAVYPKGNGSQLAPEGSFKTQSQNRSSSDPINAISQLELEGYMANTLLRDTDSMSMAHSLEVRVPFVDVEVVRYVLGLPGKWKLNNDRGHRPKPLLADAVSDLLPKDFLARPKMGFTLPLEDWMQSCLRDEISSVLGDQEGLTRTGLEFDTVAKVWGRFLHSPKAVGWSRPWALYVLAKWSDLNGVTN